MKKILIFAASMMIAVLANSQIIVGAQGGYGSSQETNTMNADLRSNANILAGVQVGYMVTPKLLVSLSFNFNRNNTVDFIATDSIKREGMRHEVTEHQLSYNRSGWNITPQVRYELLRYGNMKFNLSLQGIYGKMGHSSTTESYLSWRNNHELIVDDEIIGDNTITMLDINLRPTLTYEFSEHLIAELSLDILSVGYRRVTTAYEFEDETKNYSAMTTDIYGGINSSREPLLWENGLLHLGLYYKF